MISVIKAVLSLQNEVIPKTLHGEDPTPHVDWSSGTLRLVNEAAPWARTYPTPGARAWARGRNH